MPARCPARRLCRGTVSVRRSPLHLPEAHQSAQSAHEPAQEALCGHVLLGQGRASLRAFYLRRPLELLLDLVHPSPRRPLRGGLEAAWVHLLPVLVFVVEVRLPPAVAALPNALVRALHVLPLFPSDRKPGRGLAGRSSPLRARRYFVESGSACIIAGTRPNRYLTARTGGVWNLI